MKGQRPVNLDLTTVRLPITAIASILHRITAVISWVGLGFLLVLLCMALSSSESHSSLAETYSTNFFMQFITWGFLTAFAYYCLATAKHIIQDLGFCEDLQGGQNISWAVILLGIVLAIFAGVYIWG